MYIQPWKPWSLPFLPLLTPDYSACFLIRFHAFFFLIILGYYDFPVTFVSAYHSPCSILGLSGTSYNSVFVLCCCTTNESKIKWLKTHFFPHNFFGRFGYLKQLHGVCCLRVFHRLQSRRLGKPGLDLPPSSWVTYRLQFPDVIGQRPSVIIGWSLEAALNSLLCEPSIGSLMRVSKRATVG